jgi:hypothetical protein
MVYAVTGVTILTSRAGFDFNQDCFLYCGIQSQDINFSSFEADVTGNDLPVESCQIAAGRYFSSYS